MNKYYNRRTLKDMQDCLDSDDELPTTYTEEAELPAYLDDDRFDEIGDLIEFTWLNNSQPKINLQTQDQVDCNAASIHTTPETHKKEITPSISALTSGTETLTKKGIFEEWNSTLLSNHTALQTNKTETEPLTIPLTTDGHIIINRGFLDEQDITLESKQTARETNKREDTPSIFPPTTGNRALMKRGILKEQDIICMKCFAAQTTDKSALLWFIDFLVNKDLQSEYKFLKSCLTLSQNSSESSSRIYSQTVPKKSSIKFELVVI